MKVILTGSTGFIGKDILNQCLQNPSITSVIALSRRELPASLSSNPKLKTKIVNDFLSYPDSFLQDIKGAEACIWALGKARIPDNEMARRISIDYTLAAAKAFRENLSSASGNSKKFRFIYVSGAAAERDQTKNLWVMQDYRRIRGEVENRLISYAKEHNDTFETCILRPAMVLSKEVTVHRLIFSLGPSIRVDVLAAAALDIALNGSELQIMDNSAIVQRGG